MSLCQPFNLFSVYYLVTIAFMYKASTITSVNMMIKFNFSPEISSKNLFQMSNGLLSFSVWMFPQCFNLSISQYKLTISPVIQIDGSKKKSELLGILSVSVMTLTLSQVLNPHNPPSSFTPHPIHC